MNRTKFLLGGLAVVAVLALSACTGGSGSGSGGSPCSELVFGGPPEFQTRADGLPGISKTYGCEFKDFRALDTGGPLTVKALQDGTIQAADLFTTDPAIADRGFVVLDDPKNGFAAQNVVPLINKAKATPDVAAALNSVSAKLTTDGLVQLNRALAAPDKPDVATVAKTWLVKNLLLTGATAPGVAGIIAVGSANFPENRVLAEIYAQVLELKGFTVTRRFGIGSREVYFPALKDGSIDLVPDYTGVLLKHIQKSAPQTGADEVYDALKTAVPEPLTVLERSAAEDKDAVVVTAATAQRYGRSLANYGAPK